MSSDIHTLAATFVDETVALSPILATHLGIPGHDHEWDDLSLAGVERVRDLLADQARRLAALDPPQDPWARLGRDVIATALADDLSRYDMGEHLRDLNNLTSPLQELRDVFEVMDLATGDGWRAVAGRLRGLPDAMGGYTSRLEDGRRLGVTAARRQVLEGIRQARHLAGDESFFVALRRRFDEAGGDHPGLGEALDRGVEEARRAYAEAADYLEGTYLADAVAEDGVGEERYVPLARRFLGTDLDPLETYAWGWDEVGRLLARMEQVAAEIRLGASLGEVLALLQTDPARAAASPEEFRDRMLARLRAALDDLDGTHFDVPEPIREIDVRLTPPGGALGAYYIPPTEDFSRPGTVWWSFGDKQVIPLFDQVSTAYHEGFPGHHLQNGFQVAGPGDLTRYQKLLVWYPGTGEGWALYAEDVMEELGYLESPDFVMGKLASEMLRACRVVIDIGCHLGLTIPEGQPFHPGEPWSFEAGVEMLTDYAAQDREVAVSEMNRYLGWPGQAISYKVGQQAIRDLRDEVEARGGFDPKAFHARVLEIGSTGLDVLRAHLLGP